MLKTLSKPDIANFIQEKRKELQEATGIAQKKTLDEYAKIAFSDIRKVFDENNLYRNWSDLGSVNHFSKNLKHLH